MVGWKAAQGLSRQTVATQARDLKAIFTETASLQWRHAFLAVCACIALLLGAASTQALAASPESNSTERNFPRESLGLGMSFRDVVRRWGPASEKIEFETHRRALWQYALADVTFEHGKIVSVAAPTIDGSRSGSSPSPVSEPVTPREARERVSPEAEKVLSEILQEIPSNPDSPLDGGPPPPGGYVPPPQSFAPPGSPPNMIAPYGSAPAEMYPHGLVN